MNRREIEEKLEACRPDSHDLSREELREAADYLFRDQDLAARFERQQQHDGQIAQAMREVAAPAGLADRILGQLAEASSNNASVSDDDIAAPLSLVDEDSEPTNEPSEVPEQPTSVATAPSPSRSWFLVKAVAVATAACLMLAVGIFSGIFDEPGIVTEAEFRKEIFAWRDQISSDWKSDRAGADDLIRRYPLDDMAGWPRQYQTIKPAVASQMAVFDYSYRRNKAYLFVAETQHRTSGLPTSGTAATAERMTAGWNYAAWHDGERLYVLMFEGQPNDLQNFVRVGNIALRYDPQLSNPSVRSQC